MRIGIKVQNNLAIAIDPSHTEPNYLIPFPPTMWVELKFFFFLDTDGAKIVSSQTEALEQVL